MPSRGERVYLRVEGMRFAKFINLPRWMPNFWSLLFFDLPKKDGYRVEMANSWRCSKSLANRVGILDFWQKRLKHPFNNLTNDLAKYDNFAKTLLYRAYLAT